MLTRTAKHDLAATERLSLLRDRATSFATRQQVALASRLRWWPVRRNRLAAEEEPKVYDPAVTRLGALVWRPAILGLIGSVAILLGATQSDSPFTQKLTGAWWFGIPTRSSVPQIHGPGQGLFIGVFAVYAGILLMLRAWYDIIRLTSKLRGLPVRSLVPVFVAWTLPLLVVAPLFSHDAYSYAAQGELMSHHFNPYLYGPGLLSNGSSFDALTDGIWQNVTSPYGPVFLLVDGWIVSATGHNLLVSVEVLRLLALFGTVLFAAAVPAIARSFKRDGATAFTLAALNPLVLLHLIGGAHNDALMLGLLVVGYALARRGHHVIGIILCALAAAVKVPAFIGVIYIGWEWLGTGKSVRERLRPVATAVLIACAVMAVASQVAGIGWRWIEALSNPDTVRSWLDPATGVGLLAGHLLGMVGLGGEGHLMLTLARGSALLLAAAISLVLLSRSDQIGSLRALGWSLVAVVVLGPVVQPWYLAWGVVFLAPIAEGRVRKLLCGASAASCFLGLPGGWVLIHELGKANPALIALFSALLLGIAFAIFYPRIRRNFRLESFGATEDNEAPALEPISG